MKEVRWGSLLGQGKCVFLAYDQGLEHGPSDFSEISVNPKTIISIAQRGGFTGLIVQKGIAEQYHDEIKKSRVPLIVKLNGKTNLVHGEPLSTQLCTVAEARKLGAVAVGYTIYIGSEHEAVMFHEFEEIQREAHAHGLPVIAWIYPRGKGISGKDSSLLMAYAARVALEIGADMVKLHWTGKKEDLAWAVKAAGKCKVVIAGGMKTDERTLLREIRQGLAAGVSGFAIGRNIWQRSDSVRFSQKIMKEVWE